MSERGSSAKVALVKSSITAILVRELAFWVPKVAFWVPHEPVLSHQEVERPVGHECAATRRRLAPASAVVCFCGIVTGSAGVSSRVAHGFRHGLPMGFVTGRAWVSSRGAHGFHHGAARGFISGHQSH